MYYIINIAKDNRHYFATAEHSITDFEKAQEVYKTLLVKFPPLDGWQLSLTKYVNTGEVITRNGYGED